MAIRKIRETNGVEHEIIAYKLGDYSAADIGELIEHVDENEEVIAAALDKLNTRCDTISNALSNISPDFIIDVLYSELVILRDNSELQPGMRYRIVDYVTTTNNASNSSVSNNIFDIIVTADSNNKLNENATVCAKDDDSYFIQNGANLNAWKIWYCLDNDTNRFEWADTTNGKGVIYRMIDEWGNDCPYDFKNIQFYHTYLKEGTDVPIGKYCYTFSMEDENGDILDASIFGNNPALFEVSDYQSGVHNNVIGTCFNQFDGMGKTQQILNSIIFLNLNIAESSMKCYSNNFGNNCYSLTFGEHCFYNTFGNECYGNTFGYECYENTFGNYFCENTFGDGCYGNTFGNECYGNTFGNECYGNTFGNYCYDNVLNDYCNSNIFGDDCNSNNLTNDFGNGGFYIKFNNFGNNCRNNTVKAPSNYNSFGNYCNNNTLSSYSYYNSFGNMCEKNSLLGNASGNSFGNNCNNNTLGNSAQYNSFGNGCTYNALGETAQKNSFGNGCTYNSIRKSASTTGTLLNFVNNVRFGDGVTKVILYTTSTATLSTNNTIQNTMVAQGLNKNGSSYMYVNFSTISNSTYYFIVARGATKNTGASPFSLVDKLTF